MPTIYDLPLETIGRIVTVAYPAQPLQNGDEWKARRRFLRSTSLVCRDWTPLAQAELWKDVSLSFTEELQAFVSAGPGLHPVKSLVLDASGQVYDPEGASCIEAILLGVRGVHTLQVHGGTVKTSCLCGPGLKDLKVLDLHRVRYSCQIAPSLPFNLNMLKLTFRDRPSPDLLHALSQQSSIISLALDSTGVPRTLESLLPLAPRLLSLDAAGSTGLDVFLSNCIRLKALTVVPESIPDVDRLTNSLQSLRLDCTKESDVALILDLLNSKATAVRGLESLTVHLYDSAEDRDYSDEDASEAVEDWNGWQEVEEVCRQKKIKLVVTGKLD